MASQNSIVTNFNGNSTGFVAATQRANRALDTHSRQLTRTSGQGKQAFQNLIYGVEDVAATIGTGGLAGATRAASNNITMMAMAMGGPWGAAAAVAVTTVTQLAIAFGFLGESSKKSAKDAEDALDRFNKALDKEVAHEKALRDLKRKLASGSLDERAAATEAAEQALENHHATISYLEHKRVLRVKEHQQGAQILDDLVKERGAIMSVGAASDHRIALMQDEVDAMDEAIASRKKSQRQNDDERSEIRRAMNREKKDLKDLVELRDWANQATKDDDKLREIQEGKKAQDEATKIRIANIRKEADFRDVMTESTQEDIQEVIDKEKKVLEVIKEQIKAAEGKFNSSDMQTETQNKLMAEQEAAERRIAIAIDAQKDAKKEELKIVKAINRELNASVDGSKAFAKAFQRSSANPSNPSNPLTTLANSGFEKFEDSNPSADFGSIRTNKSYSSKVGQGIDDFVKNRDRENAKRPAPAIKEFVKQRDAEAKAKADKVNIESKETAANTKMTNDILREIAGNLESGTSLEVTVGGILT